MATGFPEEFRSWLQALGQLQFAASYLPPVRDDPWRQGSTPPHYNPGVSGEDEFAHIKSTRRGRWLDVLTVLILVAISAWVRLDTAADDGALTRAPEQGLLKSDPGLLYYMTERVATAEGLVPDDWRADPYIAHPELVDIPGDYTVGQEFLYGWSWKLFGQGSSLLQWCHRWSSWLAALAVLGVWGLTRELTRSRAAALFAALLSLLLPASFRTIGFVLIREDLSLPLFAIHLWLAVRAARVGTSSAVVLASVFAALALATWHAMAFLLLLEAFAIFGLFLVRGKNALAKHGHLALAILLVTLGLVPVIGNLATLGIILLVASQVWSGWLGAGYPRTWAVSLLFSLFLAYVFLMPSDWDHSYGHVYEVLLAKTTKLGVLPANPADLSFDTRLMWQGPFATLGGHEAWVMLGVALLVGVPAIPIGLCSKRGEVFALALFSLASLVASWLILRLTAVPALLLPPLIVYVGMQAWTRMRAAVPAKRSDEDPRSLAELGAKTLPWLGALLLLWQGVSFFDWKGNHQLSWYRPERHTLEIAQMVQAIEDHVPEGEAVACDFINSTAVLAWTGRPIVLQPKWERSAARRRVNQYWDAFFGESPEEFRRVIGEEFECRYLLVDRDIMWVMQASKYSAGLPRDAASPPPNTAAAALLGEEVFEPDGCPDGFELIWSSQQGNRVGKTSTMRLFRLD